MYLSGMDIYDIMKITGHSSPSTLKRYIKADKVVFIEKVMDKYSYFKSIADYADMLYAPAPERGQSAIVFVLGMDPATYQLDAESLAFVYYEPKEDVENAEVTAAQMVNKLAAGSYQSKYFVGTGTQDFNYVYPTYNFYIAWIDADGKYHEAEVVPVSSLAE